jgi:hypothetical protein
VRPRSSKPGTPSNTTGPTLSEKRHAPPHHDGHERLSRRFVVANPP